MQQTKKNIYGATDPDIQLCIWTLSQLVSQASQTIIVNWGGDLNIDVNIDTIGEWYGL